NQESKRLFEIDKLRRSNGCLYENMLVDEYEECKCPKCLDIMAKDKEEFEESQAEWERLSIQIEREELALDEWEEGLTEEEEASILAMEQKHFEELDK
ncbi:MAG: hypothetical protein ACRCZ2_02850, partial [Fusobacteriaceae bacterium]